MGDIRRLSVTTEAGTAICVAVEDGHKLHNAIAEGLSAGVPVVVSFAGVKRLTTAFLNVAFGSTMNFPKRWWPGCFQPEIWTG